MALPNPQVPGPEEGNEAEDDALLELLLNTVTREQLIAMLQSNRRLRSAFNRRLQSGRPIVLRNRGQDPVSARRMFGTLGGAGLGMSAVVAAPTLMGLSAAGPVAGGAFAGLQAAGYVTAGSAAAGFQSVAMTGGFAALGPIGLGAAALCGLIGFGLSR